MIVSLLPSFSCNLVKKGISSIQVPQVIDQKTNIMGLSVKSPDSLNFWPVRLDKTIPSSDEKLSGSLSGMNSEINGRVIIAINRRIA